MVNLVSAKETSAQSAEGSWGRNTTPTLPAPKPTDEPKRWHVFIPESVNVVAGLAISSFAEGCVVAALTNSERPVYAFITRNVLAWRE